MIHLLSVLGILAAAGALSAIAYKMAGVVTSRRLPRSAAGGLAAAAALVLWVDTARHAALIKAASEPMRNGQKVSPGATLADGGVLMFLAFTAVTFAVSAALARRRAARPDGTVITGDARRGAARSRRGAARSWGKP